MLTKVSFAEPVNQRSIHYIKGGEMMATLEVKVSLKDTEIFKSLVNTLSAIKDDERLDKTIIEEHIQPILAIIEES